MPERICAAENVIVERQCVWVGGWRIAARAAPFRSCLAAIDSGCAFDNATITVIHRRAPFDSTAAD